jgi:ubiquinone/menaquinone biosynthesis C-methylase UbiE
MSHDPKHGHGHGHNHDHDHHHHHDHGHGHDHHHDDHHHHDHDHSHDWHSQSYVDHWIQRDGHRAAERKPILEALIAAIPYRRDAAIDVLDVGAGGGVVSEAVLAAFPKARVTLQDFSEKMLDRARKRLKGGELRYVQGDLHDPAWTGNIGGPFDLAVSGIAIHNVKDLAAMAAVYEAVRGVLKDGGCFLDYDHFDKFGGVSLHQHSMRVAGFKSVDLVWHRHPTAVLKAMV